MYHYFAEALQREKQQELHGAKWKPVCVSNTIHSRYFLLEKQPVSNHASIQSVKENQVKQSKLQDGVKLQPRLKEQTLNEPNQNERVNKVIGQSTRDTHQVKEDREVKEMKEVKDQNRGLREVKQMKEVKEVKEVKVAPIKQTLPPPPPEPINEFPTEPVKLIECPEGCGRKFNEKVLQKHVKVCRKVFQDTREVFDSKAQRELDEKAQQMAIKQSQKEQKKKKQKVDWKSQSEAFRLMIKKAKNPEMELSENEQKMLKEMTTADLIQCDYCGRKFSEKAAEKHIPFCKQQKMKRK